MQFKAIDRIISSVVLICFIFNTTISDYAFALSPIPASVNPDAQTKILKFAQEDLAAERRGEAAERSVLTEEPARASASGISGPSGTLKSADEERDILIAAADRRLPLSLAELLAKRISEIAAQYDGIEIGDLVEFVEEYSGDAVENLPPLTSREKDMAWAIAAIPALAVGLSLFDAWMISAPYLSMPVLYSSLLFIPASSAITTIKHFHYLPSYNRIRKDILSSGFEAELRGHIIEMWGEHKEEAVPSNADAKRFSASGNKEDKKAEKVFDLTERMKEDLSPALKEALAKHILAIAKRYDVTPNLGKYAESVSSKYSNNIFSFIAEDKIVLRGIAMISTVTGVAGFFAAACQNISWSAGIITFIAAPALFLLRPLAKIIAVRLTDRNIKNYIESEDFSTELIRYIMRNHGVLKTTSPDNDYSDSNSAGERRSASGKNETAPLSPGAGAARLSKCVDFYANRHTGNAIFNRIAQNSEKLTKLMDEDLIKTEDTWLISVLKAAGYRPLIEGKDEIFIMPGTLVEKTLNGLPEGERLSKAMDLLNNETADDTEPTPTEIAQFYPVINELKVQPVEIYLHKNAADSLLRSVREKIDSFNKSIREFNRKEDRRIEEKAVTIKSYTSVNLGVLLKNKNTNTRRIFINDPSIKDAKEAFEAILANEAELFKANRFITARIKKGENDIETASNQEWLFEISIPSALLTPDNLNTMRPILAAQLDGKIFDDTGESVDINDYINRLSQEEGADASAVSISERVKYFLGKTIKLTTLIAEQLRICKAFWTAA
ncbi:MAG: hypothetical protein Q8R48_06105 [Candidatus Omnitrophota bacterium]|nr:hypothetical protein [Candidatus Omnitrophota bacterium]